MVAVRDKIARVPTVVDYDHRADVLYVSLGKPVADEGEDQPKGIVLRYSANNNSPTGVTVLGFMYNHWDKHLLGLSKLVAEHLSVDPVEVQMAIERGTKR